MEIERADLVMLRLPNDTTTLARQRHYNTWFRVLFVDNNGRFIGEVEKIDQFNFTLYKKGQHVDLPIDKIQHVYKDGEQFCYSDNITICNCKGLCENK